MVHSYGWQVGAGFGLGASESPDQALRPHYMVAGFPWHHRREETDAFSAPALEVMPCHLRLLFLGSETNSDSLWEATMPGVDDRGQEHWAPSLSSYHTGQP